MSSSGSGTVPVINYGSGSDFLTSYGSGYGSGSTSQKVTVPTVPVPVPVPQHCLLGLGLHKGHPVRIRNTVSGIPFCPPPYSRPLQLSCGADLENAFKQQFDQDLAKWPLPDLKSMIRTTGTQAYT
jgi:hypothetical protein